MSNVKRVSQGMRVGDRESDYDLLFPNNKFNSYHILFIGQ